MRVLGSTCRGHIFFVCGPRLATNDALSCDVHTNRPPVTRKVRNSSLPLRSIHAIANRPIIAAFHPPMEALLHPSPPKSRSGKVQEWHG
jgi:hypothetical protein